jgi:hypothetical protein
LFSHPVIMPDSLHRGKAKTPLKGRGLGLSDAIFYPHTLEKSLFINESH